MAPGGEGRCYGFTASVVANSGSAIIVVALVVAKSPGCHDSQ